MTCPERYSRDVKDLWATVWRVLESRGDKRDEYRESVITLCDNVQAKRDFQAQVREDGLVTTGSKGQKRGHPLLAEIRFCEVAITKALEALLLTPATARRAGVHESAVDDELAAILG